MEMEQAILLSYINNYLNDLQEIILVLNYWKRRNSVEENEFFANIVLLISNLEHLRMPGYFNWINNYLDYDFFSLFRMSKDTFNILFQKINQNERFFQGGAPPIPAEQQLLMTLWWLGKGEVLLTIADRFNVVVSTVYKSTGFMLSRILNLQEQYIVWPDRNETVEIQRRFEDLAGYPGVIGAIDVCNIPFKAPKGHQNDYIDRKMQHSIKLQAVATNEKLFINIMAGFPGSVHDSRVLRNSNIYREVQNGNGRKYFYNDDSHIVGDKAYPLHSWLLTPYRDNGHLTVIQRRHNRIHSRTRVVIENAFGILKSRWRILKFINVNSIIKSVRIIAACCILHNFCYINMDIWDNFEPVENDDLNEYDGNDIDVFAELKRNNIAHNL